MNYKKSVKPIESLLAYCDLKRFSEDTKRNYSCALKMFMFYFKGKRPFEISDSEIEKYLLEIPGRSNRCTHHSVIKLFYNKVLRHPTKLKYVPYPEKEEKLPIHVNKEEFLKIILVCNNQKHICILSLMFDCGLRISEIINLKITDIDSSNMLINILQSKRNKDRKVKLTNILLSLLRSYYLQYKPKNYLFEGQFKDQYSKRSIQEIVKKLKEKACINKNFSPHKFRHGYAMTLLENGATLDEIGNQLGHDSKKTTEIYARMNNKVIQKIESPLEQIFKENNLQKLLNQ